MISKTIGYGCAAGTWATVLTFGPPALATAVVVKAATAPYYRARRVER